MWPSVVRVGSGKWYCHEIPRHEEESVAILLGTIVPLLIALPMRATPSTLLRFEWRKDGDGRGARFVGCGLVRR